MAVVLLRHKRDHAGQKEARPAGERIGETVQQTGLRFQMRRGKMHLPPEKLADTLTRLSPPTAQTPLHYRARRQTRTLPNRMVKQNEGF